MAWFWRMFCSKKKFQKVKVVEFGAREGGVLISGLESEDFLFLMWFLIFLYFLMMSTMSSTILIWSTFEIASPSWSKSRWEKFELFFQFFKMILVWKFEINRSNGFVLSPLFVFTKHIIAGQARSVTPLPSAATTAKPLVSRQTLSLRQLKTLHSIYWPKIYFWRPLTLERLIWI